MAAKRHCHVQIEYTNKEGQVETLTGFDPTDEERIKFVHDMLDEYLRYLRNRFEQGIDKIQNKDNGFRVFDLIDCH